MSKITAADVKKLRDQTGAGMMDVKKALVEAEGDTEKAIDLLRKQGQKLSVRRAEREAKEGVVIAKVNENKDQGVVIRLRSEEHTSELQSRGHLVCRLLLEKKKKRK